MAAVSQNGSGSKEEKAAPLGAEFAERLEAAARLAGYTSERQVAQAMGVSRSAVAAWWQGRNGLTTARLKKYAALTGKPVGWFYGEGRGTTKGAEGEASTTPALLRQVAEVFRLVVQEGLRLDAALDKVTGHPELLAPPERQQYQADEPRLRRILERESRNYLEYWTDEGVIRVVTERVEREDPET